MTEGRDNLGRFAPGNKAGKGNPQTRKGNPYTRKAAELRRALYSAVTAEDMRRIVETMKRQALAGNLKAIELLLNRVLGTANQGIDLLERLEALEAATAERLENAETEPAPEE